MPLSTHLCMHKISKLCLCEGHVAMRDRKGLQSLKTEIVSQQSLVFYFAFFSTTVAAQIPSASQSIKYEPYDMYTTSDIHYASYFCAPMIHIFHKWQVRTSIRLHENACSVDLFSAIIMRLIFNGMAYAQTFNKTMSHQHVPSDVKTQSSMTWIGLYIQTFQPLCH